MAKMRESIQWKKEWLLRYLYAKRDVNKAAEKILEATSTNLHACDLEGIHAKTGFQHGLEENAIKMERLWNNWIKAKENSAHVWFEITEALDAIPDSHFFVLHYRYKKYERFPSEQGELFEGTRQLSWEEIAYRMDCSRDRACHIHGEALELLSVPEEWKLKN